MNDDMERRLRELFEDKATESAAASRAPEPVVKRARRRQVGTIAVSVVTVIALGRGLVRRDPHPERHRRTRA